MPGGNRTGPTGQGPGKGRGGMGGRGSGMGGNCVCPSCGTKVAHQAGSPCYDISCPKCGTKMVRE